MWREYLVFTGHPLKVPACLQSHWPCCQNQSAPFVVKWDAKIMPFLFTIANSVKNSRPSVSGCSYPKFNTIYIFFGMFASNSKSMVIPKKKFAFHSFTVGILIPPGNASPSVNPF